MALGKTIQYTPFQETSFGYGAGEIASAHSTEFPNGTDIVKVVIDYASGNFDETGHISTPVNGTAVSIYNSDIKKWEVKGERDDVDAVLAALDFFPSDYPDARTWEPTALKDNQTTGNYGTGKGDGEEEPDEIPDAIFILRVYDPSNLNVAVSSYTVTLEANGPTYGNQRPYWSVEPTPEDLSGSAASNANIDLGTIAHGTDTENVSIKAKTFDYGTTTPSLAALAVTPNGNIYVGEKKPVTEIGYLFSFTGTLEETQAYLDNIKVSSTPNNTTFDVYLELSDGVVGSKLTKTCWFSQSIPATTFPSQATTEDFDLFFDTTGFTVDVSNMPEVDDRVDVTITLSPEALAAISRVYNTSNNNTVTLFNGNEIRWSNLLTSSVAYNIGFLAFELNTDYNGTFTFDVDVTAENTTIGSSYSMVTQTVTCTVAATPEYTFTQPSEITWEEDHYVPFDSGLAITDMSFSGAATYTVTARAKDTDGNALTTATWETLSYGSATVSGSGTVADPLTISGSRADCNTALANLRMTPDLDWIESPATDGKFNLEFKIVRDNDGSNTDFPNYDITVPFAAGTALDPITFDTNNIGYFESNQVRSDSLLQNKLKASDFISNIEMTEEIYTGNYSVTIATDVDVAIEGLGSILDMDFVEDGYVDQGYSRYEYTYTGNKTNVQSFIRSLNVSGYDQDFTMSLELSRTIDNSLFSTSLNYKFFIFPDFDNTSHIYADWIFAEYETALNKFQTSDLTEEFDFKYKPDYTGPATVPDDISVERMIYGSWRSSAKSTSTASYTGQIDQTNYSFETVAGVSTGAAIIEATVTGELDTDNEAQYEEFYIVTRLDSHTANGVTVPTTFKSSDIFWKRLVASKVQISDASNTGLENKLTFYPPAYNIVDANKVGGQWDSGTWWRSYEGRNKANISDNVSNAFPYSLGTNVAYDHLFAAGITTNGQGQEVLTFYHSDATTSTNLNTDAIGVDTVNTITYNLGYTGAAKVIDAFYDEANLKFYVLVAETLNTFKFDFIVVDTLSGLRLDTNSTPTVIKNRNAITSIATGSTLQCGTIGRTLEGDVFLAVHCDRPTGSDFMVVWQGSSWTQTYLSNVDSVTNDYYSQFSLMKANTSGCFTVGGSLWIYENGAWTKEWSDAGDNSFGLNYQIYNTALTKDFIVKSVASNPADPYVIDQSEIYQIVATPNGSNYTYNFEIALRPDFGNTDGDNGEWWGSKRGNVLLHIPYHTGSSTTGNLYRYTT